MRFFDFKHLVSTVSVPTLDNFRLAKEEIEIIIKNNSEFLACALWWGSVATKTIKITSDLDLVFVYPLKSTRRIEVLCKQIKDIASINNVPVEIMCLPEEFYFEKHELDLGKFLMIKEYEELDHDVYICGDRGLFTLEKFGFDTNKTLASSLLKKSYKDYIRHKYDRWMRVSSDWIRLSEEEKCLQAGKFISMPAHAIRKFTQSIGQNAIGFENCIKDEEHPINCSHINSRLIDIYVNAEMLKEKYSYDVQRYIDGNISIDDFIEYDFLNNAMQTARSFILLAAQDF